MTKVNLYKYSSIIFIVTYFISSIRINDQLYSFYFHNLEAFVIPCFGLIIILLQEKRYDLNNIFLLFMVLLIVITYFLYGLAFYNSPIVGTTMDYYIKSFKGYGYVFSTLIFALYLLKSEYFVKYFEYFAKFSIYFTISTFFLSPILYKFTGVLLFANESIGGFRTHAFLSEPSSFSSVVFISTISTYNSKNKYHYLLLLLTLVSLQSPTCIVAFFLALIFLFLENITLKKFSFLIAFIMILYVLYTFLEVYTTYDFLSNSDNSILLTASRLRLAVDYLDLGTENSGNTRISYLGDVWEHMTLNNLIYTGYGLNSSAVYFHEVYNESRDISFLATMLFSYGIFGLVVIYLLMIVSLVVTFKKDRKLFYILLGFAVMASLNGAQGFVLYKFVFLSIFLNINYFICFIKSVSSRNFMINKSRID